MSLLKFILHLISCLGLTLLTAVAGEPRGQFLILRAGNETADPLVVAVKGKKFAPDELTSRITALIDEKKIEQLARFDQAFGEGRFDCKHSTGEMIDLSGEEKMDMGVTLEGGVTLANDSLKTSLRFSLEIRDERTRDDYFQRTIINSHDVYGDHWALITSWRNSMFSTLALFRVIDHPFAAVTELDSPVTELQVEVLEVKTDDLAQFRKSTLATRQKALLWLRERSEPLASTTLKSDPDRRTRYSDELLGFKGEMHGLSFESVQITSGDGKKVDIAISAKWQDFKNLSTRKDCPFTVGETLNSGQTEIYDSPAARLFKATQPILLITPQVTLPQNHPQEIVAAKNPSSLPDKISMQAYPVAAKFMRTLREMHGPPDPNKFPTLKEMLVKLGQEFGPETAAMFGREGCKVYLTQTREGHLKFMAMVKALNLQP